jgi:uncharacterized cupredoxin-like copper-binding protein
MKKALAILLMGTLTAVAFAAGTHGSGHDDAAKPAASMPMDMKGMHDQAVGQAGDPAKVNRTVAVSLGDDMRFTPSQISVKAGETIRFFVKNSGKLQHEMVIGTLDELTSHAEMMRTMPGMKHAEPNTISLAAGQRGGIVWQFDEAGSVDFACLVPGHLEAGMVGQVLVE